MDLPANGHRRTPGLRREEVSQLAGFGLSWYTWLEQGRDITPSASVLDALARVYDLDPPERAHLFHLAGIALPGSGGDYPVNAPAELSDVILGLEPNPAYLIGPRTHCWCGTGRPHEYSASHRRRRTGSRTSSGG